MFIPTESVTIRARGHEGIHAIVEQIWFDPSWKRFRVANARGWLPSGRWPEPAEPGHAYELLPFPPQPPHDAAGPTVVLVWERRVWATIDGIEFEDPEASNRATWVHLGEIYCLTTCEHLANAKSGPVRVLREPGPRLLVVNCEHQHARVPEFSNLALHAMMSGTKILDPKNSDPTELWVPSTDELHEGMRVQLTVLRPLAWCKFHPDHA